jgi:hypothetical protein
MNLRLLAAASAIAMTMITVPSVQAATLPGAENVTGCTKKDQRAIVAAVAATPAQKVAKIDSGQCVSGWAVVFPITAGADGFEYTQVLRKTGGKWALVQRTAAVCGNGPVKNDYYKKPAGAQIAPEIYTSACQTN